MHRLSSGASVLLPEIFIGKLQIVHFSQIPHGNLNLSEFSSSRTVLAQRAKRQHAGKYNDCQYPQLSFFHSTILYASNPNVSNAR